MDLNSLSLVPLYHVLWDSLKVENYELCAEVKKEIEYRKKTNTLCPFSVTILRNSDYPTFGLLDGVVIEEQTRID